MNMDKLYYKDTYLRELECTVLKVTHTDKATEVLTDRTIFYPDKIDFDSDGLTMYFRPLSGKDTEAVKIDSGITDYGNDRLNQRYQKTVMMLDNLQKKTGTRFNVIQDAKALMDTYITSTSWLE